MLIISIIVLLIIAVLVWSVLIQVAGIIIGAPIYAVMKLIKKLLA